MPSSPPAPGAPLHPLYASCTRLHGRIQSATEFIGHVDADVPWQPSRYRIRRGEYPKSSSRRRIWTKAAQPEFGRRATLHITRSGHVLAMLLSLLILISALVLVYPDSVSCSSSRPNFGPDTAGKVDHCRPNCESGGSTAVKVLTMPTSLQPPGYTYCGNSNGVYQLAGF